MGLVEIARRSFFLQNLAARLVAGVPPAIGHNVEKLAAIRRAFAYTSVEGVKGDYLEFGVFEGTSLVGAIEAFRAQRDDSDCHFVGFDSFAGFRLEPGVDRHHPTFSHQGFASSFDRVQRRLSRYGRHNRVSLVRGYFADTATPERLRELHVTRVRVCLIDCDLKSSTTDLLNGSSHLWQPGTALVIDDWFNYLGNPEEGVAGAFSDFQRRHPEVRFRDYGFFGTGGIVRIVVTPRADTNAVSA